MFIYDGNISFIIFDRLKCIPIWELKNGRYRKYDYRLSRNEYYYYYIVIDIVYTFVKSLRNNVDAGVFVVCRSFRNVDEKIKNRRRVNRMSRAKNELLTNFPV